LRLSPATCGGDSHGRQDRGQGWGSTGLRALAHPDLVAAMALCHLRHDLRIHLPRPEPDLQLALLRGDHPAGYAVSLRHHRYHVRHGVHRVSGLATPAPGQGALVRCILFVVSLAVSLYFFVNAERIVDLAWEYAAP